MKIFLDPGHGGDDLGATFEDLNEKDIVLDVCRSAQNILQYRHWVAMSRNTDINIPLSSRCELANKWGADIFLSVHCNADPDPDLPGMPEANGEEIWIYPGSSSALILAKSIKNYVDDFFPLHGFRGIKEAPFFVLRETKMPAVLIEIGFIDHFNTAHALKKDYIKVRVGRLIARGVRKYEAHIRGA